MSLQKYVNVPGRPEDNEDEGHPENFLCLANLMLNELVDWRPTELGFRLAMRWHLAAQGLDPELSLRDDLREARHRLLTADMLRPLSGAAILREAKSAGQIPEGMSDADAEALYLTVLEFLYDQRDALDEQASQN